MYVEVYIHIIGYLWFQSFSSSLNKDEKRIEKRTEWTEPESFVEPGLFDARDNWPGS